MISLLKKVSASGIVGIAFVGLLVLLPGCTHRKFVQVGTHKVTVARHGFEKRLRIDSNAAIPTFEYDGVATDGKGLKVSIEGDKVTVNGKSGQLRAGDSVFITDDGLRVNSLDCGESEKYLHINNAPIVATTSN